MCCLLRCYATRQDYFSYIQSDPFRFCVCWRIGAFVCLTENVPRPIIPRKKTLWDNRYRPTRKHCLHIWSFGQKENFRGRTAEPDVVSRRKCVVQRTRLNILDTVQWYFPRHLRRLRYFYQGCVPKKKSATDHCTFLSIRLLTRAYISGAARLL